MFASTFTLIFPIIAPVVALSLLLSLVGKYFDQIQKIIPANVNLQHIVFSSVTCTRVRTRRQVDYFNYGF